MANPAAVLSILVTANTGQASGQLARLQGQLSATQKTAQSTTAKTATAIGQGATRAATAIGLIGAGAIAAAAKYEDAFADVRKTVDASDAEFDKLEQGILDLSKTIPVGAEELAHLAGEAGALGVEAPKLLKFTKVAAGLGEATDLSASAAATALARLGNVMQTETAKDFERMGATLVDLGNKGASTEAEITEMALRIGGAGQTVGLTTQEVLGLAASLANVGVRAEAGGSAISRVMLSMQDAVAKAGVELEKFAEIAGVTPERFEAIFKRDPAKAIEVFVAGLDKVKDSGDSVSQTLEGVELNEIRVRDALLRLGGATGEVSKAQEIANKAWEENSALAEETRKRYKTTSSQFDILKNRVFALGVTFGRDLLPRVNEAMEALGEGKFDKAIGEFAKLGTEMAGKLLKAFGQAFLDAGFWTKLLMGGALIRLLGGRGALASLGMMMGRSIGQALGLSTVETAGKTIQKGAGSTGRLGRMQGYFRGVGSRLGAAMGGAMVAQIGGQAIGGEIGQKFATIGTAAAAGFAVAGPWGAAGGAIAGAILDGMRGKGLFERVGDDTAEKSTEEILKNVRGFHRELLGLSKTELLPHRSIASLEEFARNTELSAKQLKDLKRGMAETEGFKEWRDQLRAIADDRSILKLETGFQFLRNNIGSSMADIAKVTKDNMQIIARTLGTKSKQGQEAMAENWRLAAKSMQDAMREGLIPRTKENLQKVRDLLRKANFADPMRNKAVELGRTWARGLDTMEEITGRGVRDMVRLLGKLKGGARKAAFEAAMAHLKEARRHGEITEKQYKRIKSAILAQYDDLRNKAKDKTREMSEDLQRIIAQTGEAIRKYGSHSTIRRPGPAGGGGRAAGAAHGGLVVPDGIRYMQRGGMAKGTDTVPAMLTPGEFVVNAKAVKKLGLDKMSELNKGKMPDYAEGLEDQAKKAEPPAKKLRGIFTDIFKTGDDTGEKTRKKFGDHYKGLGKDSIDEAQKLQRKVSDEFKATKENADKSADRMRKGVDQSFDKTTKNATDRSKKLHGNVTDNFQKTKTDVVKSTGQMKQGVDKDYSATAGAVNEGLSKIARMTNSALKALGVKRVDFNIGVQGKQRGGKIPGDGVGDTVPAMLEPGEFVVNKKATKAARPMLEQLNKDVPRFAKGGWVGDSPAGLNPAVKSIAQWAMGRYGASAADTVASRASSSWHPKGAAVDLVSSNMLAMAKGLVRNFQPKLEELIHTPLGYSISGGERVPAYAQADHYDHVHIAALGKAVAAVAKKIKRLVVKGPDGPLKDTAQASLDKAHGAANKFLSKQGGPGGDVPRGGGMWSVPELERLWRATGSNGDPNLMARIGFSESAGGDPNAVSSAGARGLWQIMPYTWADFGQGSFSRAFIPKHNATAAHKILASQGLGAWDVWNFGMVRQKGGIVPYVGAFQQGGEVAKTGLGLLHEGERVVPKRDTGGTRAGRDRGRDHGEKHGMGVERIRRLRENMGKLLRKDIPKLDESIDIASQLAGLTTSPGGSELSKEEVEKQVRLQRRLLARLTKVLHLAERGAKLAKKTTEKLEDQAKRFGKKGDREQRQLDRQVGRLQKIIKEERKKDKPDRKRIQKAEGQIKEAKKSHEKPLARFREEEKKRNRAIRRIGNVRGPFREAMVEMEGLTGHGGRIFDTSLAIKELKASQRPQAIGIGELLEFAEALRYGAFNRQLADSGLPKFAQGGVVPGRAGEAVPIIAHAGEQVTPRGQIGSSTVNRFEVRVYVGNKEITDIVRTEVKEKDRRDAGRYRAGVMR